MESRITKARKNLPDSPQDLYEFTIIGKEKVNAHRAKIRAIQKVGKAHTAKNAALQDAQDMATIVLYAEQKLGEVLREIPNKKASSGAGTRSLPHNITKNGMLNQ